MTNVANAGTDVRRRVRNAFTLLWGGLFAAAIGWLAIVATTFFLSLARGTNASLWGMNLTVEADGGFQMMFDGQQLGVMLAAAAVIGALVGALLPARVRG